MARPRVIVGVGEAALLELPDHDAPAGLAIDAAIAAARLGHAGVALSRIGQDQWGSSLLQELSRLGVSTEHLQSDPDLPTARVIARTGAPDLPIRIDTRAAFDELQWDFDLSDLAQRADGVVFGALARRFGQSRTTIDRFLVECRTALRVFDLTNRDERHFERAHIIGAMPLAQALVVDQRALELIAPGAQTRPPCESIAELIREYDLSFVVDAAEDGSLAVQDANERNAIENAPYSARVATIVSLLHTALAGAPMSDIAAHAHRAQSPPRSSMHKE